MTKLGYVTLTVAGWALIVLGSILVIVCLDRKETSCHCWVKDAANWGCINVDL